MRARQAAEARRFGEARGICQDVLAATPEHPGALGLLGGIAGREGRHDEAIGLLERAVVRQPNIPSWHSNLSTLYRMGNRLDEALRAAQAAARLLPENAPAQVELALTHLTRGERAAAVASFCAAIGLDPDNANAHMGLGEMLLADGAFGAGWREYEWRNKLDQARGTLPRMRAMAWNGMRLPAGRILLVADQGFGDAIQFARFIPRVVERCREVVCGWGPEVVALFRDMPGIAQCFATWSDVPPHDAYVLLSSLPGLFGTRLETIPAPIPYMQAEPGGVRRWAEQLDARLGPSRAAGGRLRVALAWAGRPTHPNDARRSLALARLQPILQMPEVAFVSVQKPMPEADRAFAATLPEFLDLSPALTDFAETAAVLANVDLLLAVDTAVVHLAGALGRPAWVLVATPSDWRWLCDRSDSPWYPSLRLFRQTSPGDWGPVIAGAAAALGRLADRPAAAPTETVQTAS